MQESPNDRAVTAKERSRHKDAGNNGQNERWHIAPRLPHVPISNRGPLPRSHGSVIGGSDNHGRLNQSFFLEWGQRSWGRN